MEGGDDPYTFAISSDDSDDENGVKLREVRIHAVKKALQTEQTELLTLLREELGRNNELLSPTGMTSTTELSISLL